MEAPSVAEAIAAVARVMARTSRQQSGSSGDKNANATQVVTAGGQTANSQPVAVAVAGANRQQPDISISRGSSDSRAEQNNSQPVAAAPASNYAIGSYA